MRAEESGAPEGGALGASYEGLRSSVLEGSGGGGAGGLAVLLRCGMRVWMKAWRVGAPVEREVGGVRSNGVASGLREEVARVLVGMVLSREGAA